MPLQPDLSLIRLSRRPNSSIKTICKAVFYCRPLCHSEDGPLFIKENKSAGICLDHMSESEKTTGNESLESLRDESETKGYASQTSVNGEV